MPAKVNLETKQQNIKKPALTAKTLLLLTAVFLSLKLLLVWSLPEAETQASDLTVANILAGVNRERELRNLITLNANQMLAVAAQSKADDMMSRHYFSHVDPEGNYIWPKIEAAGYTPYSQLGENLAIEFLNTESLVSAWMTSPTHRANILQEGFKDQGVGLSFGDVAQNQYRSAVVNAFGTLAAASKPPVLSVTSNPAPAPVEPSPAPAPAPAKTTPPAKPAPAPAPAPQEPEPAKALTPTSPRQPLALRGEENLPSFALPQHNTATPAPASTSPVARPIAAAAGVQPKTDLDTYQIGRYLTLGAGLLLLILLLSDLRNAAASRLQKLDKKANNLVLLVLALIVIALMYWL